MRFLDKTDPDNAIDPNNVIAIFAVDTTGTKYRVIYVKDITVRSQIDTIINEFINSYEFKTNQNGIFDPSNGYALVQVPGEWRSKVYSGIGPSILKIFNGRLHPEGI